MLGLLRQGPDTVMGAGCPPDDLTGAAAITRLGTVTRCLGLLDGLRSRLALLGLRAELREHLLGLVVFAAPPALPLCVFVTPDCRYFSWRNGTEFHPVTDLPGAALRLRRGCGSDLPPHKCRPDFGRARNRRVVDESAAAKEGKPVERSAERTANHRDSMRRQDSVTDAANHMWPFSSQLEMAPLKTAVACGRLHVRNVTREWQLGHASGDAEMLTSELLTNGVKASSRQGTPVRLRLLADRGQLIIEAWDRNPDLPRLRQAASTDESGRGLMVVAAIASRWGVYRSTSWKVVWAELLISAPDKSR